jgi:hypothetical protein
MTCDTVGLLSIGKAIALSEMEDWDTAGCTYFGVRVETAAYRRALEERQPSETVLDFLVRETIRASGLGRP